MTKIRGPIKQSPRMVNIGTMISRAQLKKGSLNIVHQILRNELEFKMVANSYVLEVTNSHFQPPTRTSWISNLWSLKLRRKKGMYTKCFNHKFPLTTMKFPIINMCENHILMRLPGLVNRFPRCGPEGTCVKKLQLIATPRTIWTFMAATQGKGITTVSSCCSCENEAHEPQCWHVRWGILTRHTDLTRFLDTLTCVRHCYLTLLWDTLAWHSGKTLTWHSCTTLWLDTFVGHSDLTLLLDTLYKHSDSLTWRAFLTLLWDTLTRHSCTTLSLDALSWHFL